MLAQLPGYMGKTLFLTKEALFQILATKQAILTEIVVVSLGPSGPSPQIRPDPLPCTFQFILHCSVTSELRSYVRGTIDIVVK
jgi:hypothetical protein